MKYKPRIRNGVLINILLDNKFIPIEEKNSDYKNFLANKPDDWDKLVANAVVNENLENTIKKKETDKVHEAKKRLRDYLKSENPDPILKDIIFILLKDKD